MTKTIAYFTETHAATLGLDVLASPMYAVPVVRDCVGLCIGRGKELHDDAEFFECQCWSSSLGEALPAVMCETCWEDARNEW